MEARANLTVLPPFNTFQFTKRMPLWIVPLFAALACLDNFTIIRVKVVALNLLQRNLACVIVHHKTGTLTLLIFVLKWISLRTALLSGTNYMGHAMRQSAFGHMRTAKAQISLRIRAGWSGRSLSASIIIGYYWLFQWRVNVQIRIWACVVWFQYAHFAHARRHVFARDSLYNLFGQRTFCFVVITVT